MEGDEQLNWQNGTKEGIKAPAPGLARLLVVVAPDCDEATDRSIATESIFGFSSIAGPTALLSIARGLVWSGGASARVKLGNGGRKRGLTRRKRV